MAEKTHSKASRTENSLRNVTCSIVAYVAKFAASFFFAWLLYGAWIMFMRE